MSSSGPLAGIRVIELAGIGPAPYACMLMSDLGADVLRLERASGSMSTLLGGYDILSRGRRSVAIDLKAEGARELVLSLCGEADVLVEAYRPGVAERLGVGPDDCLGANPALIYARMTGWGPEGPLADRVGHDLNYASITGAIAAIGEPGRKPVPPLNLVADFGGGSMFCVMGVLAALVERATSGKGQVVDVAMVDGVTSLLSMAHGQNNAGIMRMERGANMLDGGTPYYDTYECSDGEYVSIGALEPQFYAELVRVLGCEDIVQNDTAGWPAMRERFTAIFKTKTRAEWEKEFDGVDACFAPILNLTESKDSAHLQARQTLVDVNGSVQPAPAPRFSRTPGAIQNGPRKPGQDTKEALADWGIDEGTISKLLDAGAVTQTD
jgi:alpha-methylacyl-CoA racemase